MDTTLVTQDHLKVLLLDNLSPSLRQKIHRAIAREPTSPQDQADFNELYKDINDNWLRLNRSPLTKAQFLFEYHQYLQFLVDDLTLDYIGEPYNIDRWMRASHNTTSEKKDDFESSGFNVLEEMTLDRAYVESKLSDRLRCCDVNYEIRSPRRKIDLMRNIEQDRQILESLSKLTTNLSEPAFVTKLLTDKRMRQIRDGMDRAAKTHHGWLAGRVFKAMNHSKT